MRRRLTSTPTPRAPGIEPRRKGGGGGSWRRRLWRRTTTRAGETSTAPSPSAVGTGANNIPFVPKGRFSDRRFAARLWDVQQAAPTATPRRSGGPPGALVAGMGNTGAEIALLTSPQSGASPSRFLGALAGQVVHRDVLGPADGEDANTRVWRSRRLPVTRLCKAGSPTTRSRDRASYGLPARRSQLFRLRELSYTGGDRRRYAGAHRGRREIAGLSGPRLASITRAAPSRRRPQRAVRCRHPQDRLAPHRALPGKIGPVDASGPAVRADRPRRACRRVLRRLRHEEARHAANDRAGGRPRGGGDLRGRCNTGRGSGGVVVRAMSAAAARRLTFRSIGIRAIALAPTSRRRRRSIR